MESNNPDLELTKLFDVKGKVALVTGGGINHRAPNHRKHAIDEN